MNPYGRRDRIAAALRHWIMRHWIMRHVASERYRKMIDGSVRYGLAAAASDEAAGFTLPIWIMCAVCGGGRTAGVAHECRTA